MRKMSPLEMWNGLSEQAKNTGYFIICEKFGLDPKKWNDWNKAKEIAKQKYMELLNI